MEKRFNIFQFFQLQQYTMTVRLACLSSSLQCLMQIACGKFISAQLSPSLDLDQRHHRITQEHPQSTSHLVLLGSCHARKPQLYPTFVRTKSNKCVQRKSGTPLAWPWGPCLPKRSWKSSASMPDGTGQVIQIIPNVVFPRPKLQGSLPTRWMEPAPNRRCFWWPSPRLSRWLRNFSF